MALVRRNILQIQRVEPRPGLTLGPTPQFPQGYDLRKARVTVGSQSVLYTTDTGTYAGFRRLTTVGASFGDYPIETRTSTISASTIGLGRYQQPGGGLVAGTMKIRNLSAERERMDPGQRQGLNVGIPWSSVAGRKIISSEFFLGGELVVPIKIETLSMAKQEYAVTLKRLGVPEGFEYYAQASKFAPKEFAAIRLREFGGAKSLLRTKSFLGRNATVSFKFE